MSLFLRRLLSLHCVASSIWESLRGSSGLQTHCLELSCDLVNGSLFVEGFASILRIEAAIRVPPELKWHWLSRRHR